LELRRKYLSCSSEYQGVLEVGVVGRSLCGEKRAGDELPGQKAEGPGLVRPDGQARIDKEGHGVLAGELAEAPAVGAEGAPGVGLAQRRGVLELGDDLPGVVEVEAAGHAGVGRGHEGGEAERLEAGGLGDGEVVLGKAAGVLPGLLARPDIGCAGHVVGDLVEKDDIRSDPLDDLGEPAAAGVVVAQQGAGADILKVEGGDPEGGGLTARPLAGLRIGLGEGGLRGEREAEGQSGWQ
jgi:hypothetical protein